MESVTEVTEVVTNPDTAIHRQIEMLQSHRSKADQATIKALHNGGTKAVMRSKSNLLSDTVENEEDADQPVATISKVQEWSSRAADYGQGEAERFLGGNFFWRFMMLFPAVHNWLKISQLSILLPYSVRVVLIGMKVVGNQALNALFFTSKAPVPDSDPTCNPPPDVFERWVQAVTVGITTAFLTDLSIYGLYWVQQKKVIERDWEDKMKIAQRSQWRYRTILFWILTLLYGSICQLYTILFIANVREVDSEQWLETTLIGVLQDLFLKPFLLCLIHTTMSTIILYWKGPTLKTKIQEKWIEDTKTAKSFSKDFNFNPDITEDELTELRPAAAEKPAAVTVTPESPEVSAPGLPGMPESADLPDELDEKKKNPVQDELTELRPAAAEKPAAVTVTPESPEVGAPGLPGMPESADLPDELDEKKKNPVQDELTELRAAAAEKPAALTPESPEVGAPGLPGMPESADLPDELDEKKKNPVQDEPTELRPAAAEKPAALTPESPEERSKASAEEMS